MSKHPERRPFRAARTLQVVRDNTLGGLPVLLLGYWLDRNGQPEEAQVLTFTANRRLSDLSGWHGEPVHQHETPLRVAVNG
jgi:hypothetical protein